MKIGIVYTIVTPEFVSLMEGEIKSQLGEDVEIVSWKDETILQEVRDVGYVTKTPAAKLVALYMEAIKADCDLILNGCSSVGEVADSVASLSKYIGVPIVRIDEEMCKEGARKASKIAVMATLATTLEPTKNTIKRVAREIGKHVEVKEVLVEGAFGLSQDQFKARMLEEAKKNCADVEVIIFAQGSMAYCEGIIAEECNKTVLSSPRYGAIALKKAAFEKGML